MQWKIIESHPDYEISESGDVRRCRATPAGRNVGRLLKPTLNHGYRRFGLVDCEGKWRWVYAHQLVALAFIGPKPFDGAEVCHNDSVKLNCHYSNLRWDTHEGNSADVPRASLVGEANSQSKLTAEIVREIRELALTEPQTKIGIKFGISQGAVSDLVHKRRWSHVV